MKIAVCTISTMSHLFKSEVSLNSIKKYDEVDLFCLVVDRVDFPKMEGITGHHFLDLKDDLCQQLANKRRGDALRWSMKSRYVKFLLEQGYDQVFYIDNDIFFYNSLNAASEELKSHNFLLTPHFYPSDATKNQNWLEANYRVGLYNAGFFGATKEAIPLLDFWAECCLYNVKQSFWRGLFDDQKYLDLFPVKFDGVKVFKHKGYNFAGWNCVDHELNLVDGTYFIGKDALTFVHFAPLTVETFSNSRSSFKPLVDSYLYEIKLVKPGFDFVPKSLNISTIFTYFYYIRWKIARLFD